MKQKTLSIRPFIGAKDFELSRSFYRDLGFEELLLEPKLCLFKSGEQAFYLQDYYAKEWIENTMLFMEVESANDTYQELFALNLSARYKEVRLVPVRVEPWGSECFLHDPSGVLWHFGEFTQQT